MGYALFAPPPPPLPSGDLITAAQRRALRRAVRFDCQVVRERDFKLVGQHALDVSADGMLVVADTDILTGEDVLVSFKLPSARVWFDTDAVVARVLHGRRPTDRGRRCLGLSFQSLDRLSRWVLRTSLRGVPPPVPAREPRIDYTATIHAIALS
jgi:hypothetical protein